jgi:hypothetical protein
MVFSAKCAIRGRDTGLAGKFSYFKAGKMWKSLFLRQR